MTEGAAAGGVALVTGGSGALGEAVAWALSKDGFDIAVHANANADRAQALAADIGGGSFACTADLASWESTREMVEGIEAAVGRVSVLVNCAATRHDGLMAGQSVDEWAEVIQVNLIGTFHACRAVLPGMLRARSGRIVNIVSPAGLAASPGQTAYSASKAGVIGLTRTLAHECARRRVTVNAVSPGFMDTPMTATLPPEVREKILARVPLAAAIAPSEVARAVAFVVGSASMTGQVLSIDGGLVS